MITILKVIGFMVLFIIALIVFVILAAIVVASIEFIDKLLVGGKRND